MIIGKKDKQHVIKLEQAINEHTKDFAKEFLSYLHKECDLSYTEIAKELECSQQYINNLALGRMRVSNEKFFSLLSKMFK